MIVNAITVLLGHLQNSSNKYKCTEWEVCELGLFVVLNGTRLQTAFVTLVPVGNIRPKINLMTCSPWKIVLLLQKLLLMDLT